MLIDRLRQCFKRKASASAELPAFSLPEDVAKLLAEGRCNKLTGFIEWACNQTGRDDILRELRSQVDSATWSAEEAAKLEAYQAYYIGQYKQAYELAEPFLADERFDPDYFGLASMALYNANQFDDAYRLLRAIKPHEHLLLANQDYQLAAALICWSAGDRYLANKYMDIGMRSVQQGGMMSFNAFAIYWELGDMVGYKFSESFLDEAMRANPSVQFSQGFMALMQNDYKEGLRLAEGRYDITEAHRYVQKDLLAKPRWQLGDDISGKIVLIHGEQGLGDMIQTARFFGLVLSSAKEVIVDCPNESIALLEHNFPKITFLPLNLAKMVDRPFDVWIGTLSLPYVFQINYDNIPGRQGYLKIPADHLAYWQARVGEVARPGRVCIGIAWSGFPGHRADRRRSIPWPMARTMIEQFPEVDFFAVQIKVPDDAPANLHNCSEEMATLSDTAALIEQMDLIISVDTSVVHIAGAIGKETWMMLPYRYEWRWSMEGEDNNWYDSVKVIRQPAPGAWAPVLSKVFGKRLRDFIEIRTGKTHA
jgi:tetratricopeptide (TPR) repeat protein